MLLIKISLVKDIAVTMTGTLSLNKKSTETLSCLLFASIITVKFLLYNSTNYNLAEVSSSLITSIPASITSAFASLVVG